MPRRPRVKVEEEGKGLRITGSWGFESGCTAATYVGGMVLLSPPAPGAPPRMVAALAPAAEARIEETWDPVGLAGTGSHQVHFDRVFVPWYRTFPWPAGIPVSGYPKVDRYTQKPLLEHPATQRTLEAAEELWFACRAGMRDALAAMWASALRGEPATAELRVNVRVAAVTAVHRGAEVVRAAYDVAGASAVHRAGVLQRLLRDASCLTHHISANALSYELTGRVRSGIDPLNFRI